MSTCRTIEQSATLPQAALSRSRSTHILATAAICLVLYLLFFHRLADRDLWSSHEARAAMDAQTVLNGDWRLPHLYDGRAEMQKPPLYYWLVALAAWPRGGVDAWAVRLPAALSALAGVLFVGVLAWRRGRPFAGLAAGLILATAVHYPWLARIGRIDMPLSLTTALAIGCFHLAASSSGRAAVALLLAGYLAVAAGIMLKGPIGLILPASVIAAHRLLEWFLARRTSHSALGLWWGVPLIAALTLPWFLWANAYTGGEFFQEFFWRHNVERGLGNGELRSHPWWLYLPYFANDFLPWSPLLLLAVIWCAWRGWWRTDAEMRLGLVWLVVIVGGLSWASFKRGDYLLPAYPGAALFLGCAGKLLASGGCRTARKPLRIVFLCCWHARCRLRRRRLAGVTGLPHAAGHRVVSQLRDLRRRHPATVLPPPQPILFFQHRGFSHDAGVPRRRAAANAERVVRP